MQEPWGHGFPRDKPFRKAWANRIRRDAAERLFGLIGYFVTGGSPTLFDLGRGPITPPDPAMVRADRKDLNSNKTKQTKAERPASTPKFVTEHFTDVNYLQSTVSGKFSRKLNILNVCCMIKSLLSIL